MFNSTDKYIKKIILEEINGEFGEYSGAGECDHDFFGILLGYLGGDEYTAREFCEMARSDTPGDTLTMAMEEFNISADAEYEIRQAYAHIFGEEGAFGTAPPLGQDMSEDIGASRMPSDPGEIKKCKAGEHRCTSGGKCTKKACDHPVKGIASANIHERKEPMNITKSYLKKIILEEKENIMRETGGGARRIARVDYDEGGLRVSDGWSPAQEIAFLSFEEIEGSKEDPKTGEEIEEIILGFFDENGVGSVRDIEQDVSNIDPREWLDTMLMNHPAGHRRRPPEGSSGGHSVRDLDFINNLEGR
tara:strand:- start:3373 stop:4284 length:912 start_codon:yes stop_codon:yes gene_type:complete